MRAPLKQARFVIWIKAAPTASHSGGVLIPQTVVAYAGELLCQWQESDGRIDACSDLFKLDFGRMAVDFIKTRVLKISNPNPVAVTLE